MERKKTIEKLEDMTGRSRFSRNVVFAWGGYLVNVVAGFVMPRLISDRLGQTTLGMWDFAWSIVSYFGLVQLGLSASVDRYVARYRAVGDNEGLSRSVSTIGLFLKLAGGLALVLAISTAWWVLPLFEERLGDELNAGRLVVLFLGGEIAFSVMFTVYTGVVVGCHRWDIHNIVSAICYAVTTAGMIIVLMAGQGLPALACVHCLVLTFGEIARMKIARRVCPELVIDYRKASWTTWAEQARFSAKSLIPRIAVLLSNQTLSILVATFLGPAALAIYCRPRSLLDRVRTFAAKFGYILIPTASSLQAKADHALLQTTFKEATYTIACLVMPGVVALVVFGDDVIRFWMGDAYVYKGLMTVLVLGAFPTWVQEPIWGVVAGMNKHGRIAWAKLAGACCCAGFLWVGLAGFEWGLLGAAFCFAVPQVAVDGFVTPLIACRRLDVSLRSYYYRTFVKPLFYVGPFAGCLVLARVLLPLAPWQALATATVGAAVLALVYWTRVLPGPLRSKIVRSLHRIGRRGKSDGEHVERCALYEQGDES